jgi:hypothetical protein
MPSCLHHTPAAIALEQDERLDTSMKPWTMSRASGPASLGGPPSAPMLRPLLDCQISLIEYLTSGRAIFGQGDAYLEPTLHGIDRGLLHLAARFSHDKRMAKIVATFPKTFELLEGDGDAVAHEFADACPPADISRIENARQFYGFLATGRRNRPLKPPHLQDVAACELAFANARILGDNQDLEAQKARIRPRGWVRRGAGVVLLRCSYDIRPAFEEVSGGSALIKRDTQLAISFPPAAKYPKVFEVAPVVFDLLAAIDDWTDPATLRASPDLKELIRDLAQCGLIEGPS